MANQTVQTVKTQFVTNEDGIKFAYRRLGPSTGCPLLFLHHFRGTMDSWDPLLVHCFAAQRPVILFDNAGIGHSTGTVDNTMAKQAAHVIEFLSLLSIKEVDILGFSLGGVYAPLVYQNGPEGLVRKLILAGTSVTAGEGILPGMTEPKVLSAALASELPLETFLYLFFKPTPSSQAAGRAWWDRQHERTKETSGEERIGYVSEGMHDDGAGMMELVECFKKAGDVAYADEGTYNRMADIKIPVLVANGYEDIMVPTPNSFLMAQKIPGAFLVTYPDAGHGFLFQYAELFAKQAGDFLDGW